MAQHSTATPARAALSLLLATLLLVLLPSTLAAEPKCLRFADHEIINQAFIDGGPGTTVFLCPGKVYPITGTVHFTAADQTLATLGFPSDENRAVLRVESPKVATAVQGDCRRCANIALRNVVVDGGRSRHGRVPDGQAAPGLVVIGGNDHQQVTDCVIRDARGFTGIHVREGDKLGCRRAVIKRNTIGPIGEEYDPAVDGADPESSPLGRPLADGVSIACRDSVVSENTIFDASDAGVVVYCSPGSRVERNHISTRKVSAIGGILMVDASPFDGDYGGVVVSGNTLEAAGAAMRVGIGIGLSVLNDDIETILRGGTVTSNVLKGRFMGYGIAAAGLESWTIKENWSEARHQGKRSARCWDDPINPDPSAFLVNAASVEKSDLQDNFVDHDFAYIVCIDGLDAPDPTAPEAPTPASPEGRAEASESAAAAAVEVEEVAEEEEAALSTGNEVMDGILLHSQQRMVEAIDAFGARLAGQPRVDVVKGPNTQVVGDAFVGIEARVQTLEATHHSLMEGVKGMHSALKALLDGTVENRQWEHDVLVSVEQELTRTAPRRGKATPRPASPLRVSDGMVGAWALRVVVGGAVVVVVLAARRWRGARVGHAKAK